MESEPTEDVIVGGPADPASARGDALGVVLISTYDLGHQPFGLASPAAWLRAAGHRVRCVDLAVENWDPSVVVGADLIAFYVPMHTATRMACDMLGRVRSDAPAAHLCAYGLYAPMNAARLRGLGVETVLGGEYEESLAELADRLAGRRASSHELPLISLDRLQFRPPDRSDLPPLGSYGTLRVPDEADRTIGYTEATRGCKHLCRHCPVVPVYGGRFRVVQADVVASDIDAQVAAGAQHITFGDPDFLNAPGHATRVVEALHQAHPTVGYDVTIKIEHLVAHPELVGSLADTGCVMVTSAIEAFDDDVLDVLDKGHTREQIVDAASMLRDAGIALNATFVAFTPWTSRECYVDFLMTLHEMDLVGCVSPVQLGIRLLIPDGSRLLELPSTEAFLCGFDAEGLCHRWVHPDSQMDTLQEQVMAIADSAAEEGLGRPEVFRQVCEQAAATLGGPSAQSLRDLGPVTVADQPTMSEPWYCCAEPVRRNLEPLL